MNIETKKIVGYLPYKLQCAYLSVNGEYKTYTMDSKNFLNLGNIDKPVLKKMHNVRHLNAKLINTDGFKRWNEGANKEIGIYYYINEVRIEHLEKWLIDFLIENHFDIYGLIDKGLAYECFHENEVMRQGNRTTYSYCDDCGESI